MSSIKYWDGSDWVYLAQGVKGDKGDTGTGIPSGGTDGQVLGKVSGSPQWTTLSGTPSGAVPSGGDLTGTYPSPTLVATGTSGTYTQVTTDTKGRVYSGSNVIPAKQKLLTALANLNNVPAIPAVVSGIFSSTPTVYTTSAVTGASIPFDSRQVTFRGWLKKTVTVGGDSYIQNIANTENYTPGSGGWIEFDYYGASLEIIHYGSPSSKVWAFVDGAPISSNSIFNSTTGSSRRYYRLLFNTTAQRRIRVLLINAYFGGLNLGLSYDAVSPAEPKQLKVVMYGDSWTEGYTYPTIHLESAYTWQLGEMLDAEIFTCGQAGTGYVTNPGSFEAPFTDSVNRLPAIASISPDIIFIFGSLNDDGASGIQTAASSVYSTLASSVPNAKIIVAGPQSTGGSPSANRQANDLAVNLAANAAPNVIGYISQIGINTGSGFSDPWINGTGTISSGSGNNFIFIQPAGNHLTDAGNQYYARRFFKEIISIIRTYVYS
jgi:hypothetical protein